VGSPDKNRGFGLPHDVNEPASSLTIPKKPGFGLPNHVQQYLICMVFHLAWPVLPLSFEWIIAGHVSAKSIALTGFMYGVGMGVASRNLALLLLSLAGGLLCGVFFGLASGQGLGPFAYWVTIGIMVITFIAHSIERFNRHWGEKTAFINFEPKEGQ